MFLDIPSTSENSRKENSAEKEDSKEKKGAKLAAEAGDRNIKI